MSGIDAAAEVLRRGRRFLVTCHLSPDGDAVGSMLAVVHLLRLAGKEAVPFHCDPIPQPYRFLAGADQTTADTSLPGPFDVIVVVDVGERDRIPQELPTSADGATVLVIDHHQHHGDLGDVVWREKASAVGEMIVDLARHLGWAVNRDFAECAYTAILTDTGSFRYASTSASALGAASFLMEQGVQPWKVASNVYESWPASRVQLLGDVLGTLELDCGGSFASLVVTQAMLDARGATTDMAEGFVNEGRRIQGVEVSALFREIGEDRYRISFRSRGRVDVATIAVGLGGGGHRNASGATLDGDIDALRAQVADLVAAELEALEPNDDQFWSRH